MAEDMIYEVERILARRRTRKGKLEYMVRWKNFGLEEDTWEPLENLGDCMELVEEFNQKTMKEGHFDRLGSIDSMKKKKKRKEKKKEENANVTDGPIKTPRKDHPSVSQKLRREQLRLEIIDYKPFSDLPWTMDNAMKAVSAGNSAADGLFKAQKRKKEPETTNSGKQTNGPTMAPSEHMGMDGGGGVSPEKRMRRAHSINVVPNHGTVSGAGTSNGLTPPPQRRRLNSSMSSHSHMGMHSPSMTRSISVSPYPKIILSPGRLLNISGRKTGSTLTSMGGYTMSTGLGGRGPDGVKEEETEMQGRRTASIVARRRLSQTSPSAEDISSDSRRISARQSDSLYKYKEIVVKKCPGYTQVRLFTTTPTRNALNLKALQELTNVFQMSKKDDTKVIFLSGSGSVFCSGLDLRYVQTTLVEERKRASKTLADAVRAFVDSLINCSKVVVVAVNGPAIGLGAAILPLCDVAYASDKAYFHLPYSILGQTPEGCSSHTFPQVLGLALAGEMLYAGRKLTALEACASGLVSHTFWPTSFMQEVIPRVQRIATQSSKALLQSKLLIRGQMRAKLEYVNESECAALEERWRSPEFTRQIKLFAENYSDM